MFAESFRKGLSEESSLEWVYMKNRDVMLSEQEIGEAYAEILRFISTSRGITSDQTRQLMADAVREFYGLLGARIESKHAASKSDNQSSLSRVAPAGRR